MTQQSSNRWWNQDWFAGLLLVAATLIAYLPVWKAGFVTDDYEFWVGTSWLRHAGGLYHYWFTTEAPDYFPVTSTLMWVEWRLWGANPLGYHVVNVLLHASSVVLLWRVLLRLKIPGAWLAAAVFALHPVSVEAVAWVSEGKSTLAMTFFLLTLMAYLQFEDTGRRGWYGAALGAFVLGLLSKTAVAPLPLVLIGLACWRRGRVERRDVWRSVPFFAVAAGLALVTIWFQYNRSIGTAIVRTDSFWSRLAGAGWAVWFYLYKAALPLNLSFVYPRWQINPASLLSYVPGLLAVIGLLACWHYRRQWGKAWLCGLAYFVVMLLPILGFINISFMRYSLVADRWQYFAILGPIVLMTSGITLALDRFQERTPFMKPALYGVLLLILGTLTWRQCEMYKDPETLWRTTIGRNPNSAFARNNLGEALLKKGEVEEAIIQFQETLNISSDYAEPYSNLGSALLQKGRVDEAIAQFRKALEVQPNHLASLYNLATTLLQNGQVNEAIEQFQRAVEIQPEDALIRLNLGNALLQTGQLDGAIEQYQKALDIQPDSADACNNLGSALLQKNQMDEATGYFQRALQIDPNHANAHNNLADVFLHQGRLDDAIVQYQKTIAIQPNAGALNNLASALIQRGRLDEAAADLRKALEIRPGFAEAHNNLGYLLLQTGHVHDALDQFENALKLQPNNARTMFSLAWTLATCSDASIRNGTRAVELAERANQLTGGQNPMILRALAAAYAESGQFAPALTTARNALQLAESQSNASLAGTLRSELGFYQTGSPFHESFQSANP